MLKHLPKILPGISQKFHLLCFSVLLLCLHYAPKLPTIVMDKCKVMTAVFHYNVTVLLKSIDLRNYVYAMHLSAFFAV